jgi:hypothetical protein
MVALVRDECLEGFVGIKVLLNGVEITLTIHYHVQ